MMRHNYPHGIDYIFSGIFVCKNKDCKSVISILGDASKDIDAGYTDENGEHVERYINQYTPKFFYPYLKIIPISKKVRKEVREQLELSFSHFFNDLGSCANRIRTSIEYILDDLKAPKRFLDSQKKIKRFTNLHHRIEKYKSKTKNKKVANLLFAIKIIGNEGSHAGNITLINILDAYELIEIVLDYTYEKREKDIHLRASDIVEKDKMRKKK
jgi:hypothetical protein